MFHYRRSETMHQISNGVSSEMLLAKRKIGLWLSLFQVLIVLRVEYGEAASMSNGCATTTNMQPKKFIIVDRIMKMLTTLDENEEQNASTKLAALIVGFLIKQKERFYESTRYEAQAYSKILHRCKSIINAQFRATSLQKRILENVFQKDVELIPPTLKADQIETHLEFESLKKNYDNLVNERLLEARKSDMCFEAIVTLGENDCNIPKGCLEFIASNHPTYGYSRTHQILLLYVFMHHKCAREYGARQLYEKLADRKCSEIYREVNVIKSENITSKYRDLYVQQQTLCSLFGYTEFLNWENVDAMLSWINMNGCYCEQNTHAVMYDCHCNSHISTMLLTYYVSAMLLLT